MFSRAGLLSLPQELNFCILSFLPAKADQLHLCLSCKALRCAAIPVLYETIVFDTLSFADRVTDSSLEFQDGRKLTTVFNAQNKGLPYIKEILFCESKGNTYRNFRAMAKQLFQLLPMGTLKRLKLPRRYLLHCSDLELILSTQHNLEFLQAGPLIEDAEPVPSKPLQLSRLRTLLFLPQWMKAETFPYMNHIVRSAPNLEDLAIYRSMLFLDPVYDQPMADIVLHHIKPSDRPYLGLKRLQLQGVALNVHSELTAVGKVVNLGRLEVLRVTWDDCFPLIRMLNDLVKKGGQVKLIELVLEELYLEDDGRVRSEYEQTKLEDLLVSFKGLQHLGLSLCGLPRLLCVDAIAHHGATLKSLLLKVRVQRPPPARQQELGGFLRALSEYDALQMGQLLTACPHLEHLAMPLQARLPCPNAKSPDPIPYTKDDTDGPQFYRSTYNEMLSFTRVNGNTNDPFQEWQTLRHLARNPPPKHVDAPVTTEPFNYAAPNPDYHAEVIGSRKDMPGLEYRAYLQDLEFERSLRLQENPRQPQAIEDRFLHLCELFANWMFETAEAVGSSKLRTIGVVGVYDEQGEGTGPGLWFRRGLHS